MHSMIMTYWGFSMSMFSSGGSTITDRTKTGFLKSDIAALETFGTKLARGGTDIEKTRESFLKRKATAREKITTKGGFKTGPEFEDISDVSDEQVNRLFDIFRAREKEITARRTAPGAEQTRLVDR